MDKKTVIGFSIVVIIVVLLVAVVFSGVLEEEKDNDTVISVDKSKFIGTWKYTGMGAIGKNHTAYDTYFINGSVKSETILDEDPENSTIIWGTWDLIKGELYIEFVYMDIPINASAYYKFSNNDKMLTIPGEQVDPEDEDEYIYIKQ